MEINELQHLIILYTMPLANILICNILQTLMPLGMLYASIQAPARIGQAGQEERRPTDRPTDRTRKE